MESTSVDAEATQARGEAPQRSEPAQGGTKRKRVRKLMLWGTGALVVIIGVCVWLYLRHAAKFESTDDAFIASDVTQIAPRVAGAVKAVFVSDNQLVEQGQLLFELDSADFDLGIAKAQAALAVAQARQAQARAAVPAAEAAESQGVAALDAARTQAHLARQELDRARRLVRQGAQSQAAIEQARSNADSSAANVVAAQQHVAAAKAAVTQAHASLSAASADVHAAQVAVDDARLSRSYTRVVAPVRGRVTQRGVEAGDYLQRGQTVLSLVALRVWVTANFKETQLAHMRPGQPVSIEVDAYHRSWHGRVDSFQQGTGASFSLLPPENATGNYVKVVQRVPVKIVFDPPPDPHRYLLAPGMSVVPTVRVTTGAARPMVPAASSGAQPVSTR